MGEAEGFSSLAMSAIALHELYRSYIEAGFTEEQAMRIICTIMTASARGAVE